jgi:hypothetical protein
MNLEPTQNKGQKIAANPITKAIFKELMQNLMTPRDFAQSKQIEVA